MRSLWFYVGHLRSFQRFLPLSRLNENRKSVINSFFLTALANIWSNLTIFKVNCVTTRVVTFKDIPGNCFLKKFLLYSRPDPFCLRNFTRTTLEITFVDYGMRLRRCIYKIKSNPLKAIKYILCIRGRNKFISCFWICFGIAEMVFFLLLLFFLQ